MINGVHGGAGPWKFGHLVKKNHAEPAVPEQAAAKKPVSPYAELPAEVLENPDLLAEAIGREIPPGIYKKLTAQLAELATEEAPVEEPVVVEVPVEEPVVAEVPVEEPVVAEVPVEEPVVAEVPVEEPVVVPVVEEPVIDEAALVESLLASEEEPPAEESVA